MRIVRSWLSEEAVRALSEEVLGGIIRVVVDIRRGVLIAGGSPHTVGVEELMADGSKREDLWGVIYVPSQAMGKRVDYTAGINQRQPTNQESLAIQDPQIRQQVQTVLMKCLGSV